jgi:hypothetical protein
MSRSTLLTGDVVARGRRRKSVHLLYLLGFAGIGYLVRYLYLSPVWGTIAVALAWMFMVIIWVLFVMPTNCAYDVGDHGCTRQVWGKVGGCFQHGQLKRDAVWAAMGKRNPGMAVRLTWGHSRAQLGRQLGTNAGTSATADQQGAYNVTMLVIAAVSAGAAVISVFLAL